MRDHSPIMSFCGFLCLALLQVTVSVPVDSSSSLLNLEDLKAFDRQPQNDREKRQTMVTGLPLHRPSFFLNNVSSPSLLSTLDLISSLVPLDTSFGVHQIALLNSPTSIQDVEAGLQAAWTASNLGVTGVGPTSLTVRIIIFRDYGMFSDTGLPVIDVTYAVGVNRTSTPTGLDGSNTTLRIPDIGTLTSQLAGKSIQLCDCDVYQGYLLHLVGITAVAQNLTQYRTAVQSAWLSTSPTLNCPTCIADVQFARTVVSLGATGARLTTVPYIVLLNGHAWSAGGAPQPTSTVLDNALLAQGLSARVYRGTDTPTYAALSFVTYLNANIQFQDLAAVQRTVQTYLSRALPKPPLQVTIWNLEPFLNPQATVITQSSYFLSSNLSGNTLDPRLFYAPPVIDVMSNQTDGNITTVTGGTLGIFPLYLTGHIQASQLRSIAEILKITYAEANPGLNADDVDVAIVSLDDGISMPQTRIRRATGDLQLLTELHVSAMVNGIDPDRIPTLTPFHLLLSDGTSQDALNTRLQAFNTAVCKDCQFRRLRTLNLLQVDPTTSTIPDAQAVLDKVLASWVAANPQSAPWIPLDVSLVSRDDSLANENGTLVSQLTYQVGYPLPAFNWYIPRDPENHTLEQQLGQIKAVPFFGTPLHPQQIALSRQMTQQDQLVFASAAMRAWAEDKDDLHQCLQANANCFVAVVDPDNPTVTLVNGAPQYLYKYYILVDDRVYSPSSPLSAPRQMRLRSAIDTGNNAGPAIGGATSTVAPAQVVPVVVAPPVLVLPGNFNLTDTINLAVGTTRQRNRVLDQILQVWQAALQPNVSDMHISTIQDQSGFPNPNTPDGRPIRTITYLVQGTSSSPVDLDAAVQRFRQLLPAAGIPEVFAANPDMTTPSPIFKAEFGRTNLTDSLSTTTTTAAPVILVPVVVVVPTTLSTAITLAPTTTLAPVVQPPLLLATVPVFVGPGPFTINDTLAVTADTRRARDRIMLDPVRPAWNSALGSNVTTFQLGVTKDSTFSTPTTPDGTNIRQVDYQVQGVAKTAFDAEAAKQRFRQNLIGSQPRNVWAVSGNNGTFLVLNTIPSGQLVADTTTVAPITTTTPVVVVVVPTTTTAPPPLVAFVGSLLLRNYNTSDQAPIVQTLQALWTQALETNDSNVLVQYLPTSGNSSVLNPDGTPQYDFRYALFTEPNGTRPDQAWDKFLELLRNSDLMEYITQLPGEAPQAGSTTPASVPVIPVLSFTEKQDIALNNSGDIANVTDGLQTLWADAAGINASQSSINVVSLLPLDPPRTTVAGLPVQTLTYGVTLQNATDLDKAQQRAEALSPSYPVAQYFVRPDQMANLTSTTTANPLIVVVVPAAAELTTTIAPIILGTETKQQEPYMHSIDAYVNSAADVSAAATELRGLWAQAYGVPVDSVNLTVINQTQLNPGSTDRPVTRIQYAVLVPGQPETPAIVQTFEGLLRQSPLANVLAPVVALPAATNRSPHSIRETAATVPQMDQLTSGIRNSWVAALGLQAQPADASIVLTDIKKEGVATPSGAPISTLYYDLVVPNDVIVGPNQEAGFLQNLAQSPASQYVVWNTSTISPVAVTGPITPAGPVGLVPFAITDSAELLVKSIQQRNHILDNMTRTWTEALTPNVSGDARVRLQSDQPNTPPQTADGQNIRNITYLVTGYSNGPLDEYQAKQRFRQFMKSNPNEVTGVYLIPDVGEVPTTTAGSTTPTVVVLIPLATTVSPEAVSSTTNATVPVLVPVVVPVEVTSTTTAAPQTSYIQFLHLKRPVGLLDNAAISALIANAWAQQNNQSAANLNATLLRTDPVVDDNGALGTNVTYELLGPAGLVPPTGDTAQAILGVAGYNVCQNCFSTPVHSFYLTPDSNNKTTEPLVLREAVRQAVIAANPDLTPSTIQAAFPDNTPPQVSNDITAAGQDLQLVRYFAVSKDQNDQMLQVREPTTDQLQSQFTAGQTVYPIGSPSVIRPVPLVIQDAGSWTDGTSQPLDNATTQAVQSAMDSAIGDASSKYSLACNGSQLVKTKNLYGLFGKQYSETMFAVNSPNGTCTYLPQDIVNEIASNAQAALNRTSATAPAVQPPARLSLASEPSSDPNHVRYYDYAGRLNIFDLQSRKADLATSWLDGNPNCVQTNCSYSTLVLATQRRVATDGSDVTRVYYTIQSPSPYVVYPPQQIQTNIPASNAVQRVALVPGSQDNLQLQALINSNNAVRRRRRQATLLGNIAQPTNVNARYCYDPRNGNYIQYAQADVIVNGDKPADQVVLNNGASVQAWNQSDCPGCVCDIPVYVSLLRGHVNASDPNEKAQLATQLLQPWLTRYENATQYFNLTKANYSTYLLDQPDYKYHDASGNPLSLVQYGIQVGGVAPSQLAMDDLTRQQLETLAIYNICTTCAPQFNQDVYLANSPPGAVLNNNSAPLALALTNLYRRKNPDIPTIQVGGVGANDNTTYLLNSNTTQGSLQRLDYYVAMNPNTSWTALHRLQDPTAVEMGDAIGGVLQNPNVTVFSSSQVLVPQPVLQKTVVVGSIFTPNWLPAAIIIPLAGLIALTLLLVCLITRASRLFRTKKTVVITDPAMIQTIGAESQFKDGNGKATLNYDDYRNVGRQDVSKV